MADWMVTHKSRPGAELERWAVITDVPSKVTRDEVLSALELWSRWPSWQARMRPSSQLTVRKGQRLSDGIVEELPWARLAPTTVRLGFELDGELHARAVRNARQRGETLAAYMRGALAHRVNVLDNREPLSALGEER